MPIPKTMDSNITERELELHKSSNIVAAPDVYERHWIDYDKLILAVQAKGNIGRIWLEWKRSQEYGTSKARESGAGEV